MKVLLTGSRGFVGSHLLKRLILDYGKECVVALTSKEISDCESYIYQSFGNFNLSNHCFNDIDIVVHAGAFTPKTTDQANCISSSNSNIHFTNQLLSALGPQTKKIVYLSTLDVYAAEQLITESSPLDPASLYGMSKLYCERMIKAYGEENEVDIQILRLGHVYGPGEEAYQKLLPTIIKNVLCDNPVEIWGDGAILRSFIYIGDVVNAILASIEGPPHRIINVVGGRSICIKDLVSKVIEMKGCGHDVIFKQSELKGKDLVFDNSLLLATLIESETSLEDGLKVEFEYMKGLLS